MACKGKRNKDKLEFSDRGRRRPDKLGCDKPQAGLYYPSKCGKYSVYKGDRLCGFNVDPARWIAFSVTDGVYRVISRHLARKPAERACQEFDKSRSE